MNLNDAYNQLHTDVYGDPRIALLQNLRAAHASTNNGGRPIVTASPQDTRPSYVDMDSYGRVRDDAGRLDPGFGLNSSTPALIAQLQRAQAQQLAAPSLPSEPSLPDPEQISGLSSRLLQQIQYPNGLPPTRETVQNGVRTFTGSSIDPTQKVSGDTLLEHPTFNRLVQVAGPDVAGRVYSELTGGNYKDDAKEFTKRKIATKEFAVNAVRQHIARGHWLQDENGAWLVQEPTPPYATKAPEPRTLNRTERQLLADAVNAGLGNQYLPPAPTVSSAAATAAVLPAAQPTWKTLLAEAPGKLYEGLHIPDMLSSLGLTR